MVLEDKKTDARMWADYIGRVEGAQERNTHKGGCSKGGSWPRGQNPTEEPAQWPWRRKVNKWELGLKTSVRARSQHRMSEVDTPNNKHYKLVIWKLGVKPQEIWTERMFFKLSVFLPYLPPIFESISTFRAFVPAVPFTSSSNSILQISPYFKL